MQDNLDSFKIHKRRKKRVVSILIFTFIMALITVSMRDCNQGFDEPYNKDYQPVDQQENPGKVN